MIYQDPIHGIIYRTFAFMGTIRQQVALTDARFFAYHGYYPEEQVAGNDFTVYMSVTFERDDRPTNDQLEHTINYEQLYEIAKTEMQQTRKLLETVAEAMLHRLKREFPFVTSIEVGVTKHNPPFGGGPANASVTLSWDALMTKSH